MWRIMVSVIDFFLIIVKELYLHFIVRRIELLIPAHSELARRTVDTSCLANVCVFYRKTNLSEMQQ